MALLSARSPWYTDADIHRLQPEKRDNFISQKQLKAVYSALWETHLRATGRHLPYGITQCYLPPDIIVNAPRLNPSLRGMEGWVDLYLIAARPGVEPTTAWSQVRRPNRYATRPPASMGAAKWVLANSSWINVHKIFLVVGRYCNWLIDWLIATSNIISYQLFELVCFFLL